MCDHVFTVCVCTEECRDKHKYCGGNPGWSSSWCDSSHQYVLDNCPALCKLCRESSALPCRPILTFFLRSQPSRNTTATAFATRHIIRRQKLRTALSPRRCGHRGLGPMPIVVRLCLLSPSLLKVKSEKSYKVKRSLMCFYCRGSDRCRTELRWQVMARREQHRHQRRQLTAAAAAAGTGVGGCCQQAAAETHEAESRINDRVLFAAARQLPVTITALLQRRDHSQCALQRHTTTAVNNISNAF